MEAGFYIHPLRQAGVTLVTVNDGPIDWTDFTGRVMYQLKQEGKHQFLRDLSANTTRGLLAKANRGKWVQGTPPYGYTLDKNDRLTFGHRDAIRVVRRIYCKYMAGGSLRTITAGLNADGILSASGGHWSRPSMWEILTRRLYVGDFVWNRNPTGKYSQVRGGQVERVHGDVGIPTSTDDTIVIRDNHPAIISRAKFDQVQERLSARKPTPGHRSKPADPIDTRLQAYSIAANVAAP